MSQKACADCHLITKGNVCPKCRSTGLSDDFAGLVIVFDPAGSAIAKSLKVKEKGRYALKVR